MQSKKDTGKTSTRRKDSKRKGSQFERDFCKKLSLWWTEQQRDDVFWRTAGSGARSTGRAKKGETTAYSSGDVGLLDPCGECLLKSLSIEIKRGYSKETPLGFVEGKPGLFLSFIEQSVKSRLDSGTLYWMLVTKRDARNTLVSFPYTMIDSFADYLNRSIDYVLHKFREYQITHVRASSYKEGVYEFMGKDSLKFITISLEEFFRMFDPGFFKEITDYRCNHE